MTATSERIAAAVERDERLCDVSPDRDGMHCNHWFHPRNGGQQGESDCCYCDHGHDCHALDEDDGWDEICRCDGICECGQDDGRTDPSWAAEWDAVDEDRTEVAAW